MSNFQRPIRIPIYQDLDSVKPLTMMSLVNKAYIQTFCHTIFDMAFALSKKHRAYQVYIYGRSDKIFLLVGDGADPSSFVQELTTIENKLQGFLDEDRGL